MIPTSGIIQRFHEEVEGISHLESKSPPWAIEEGEEAHEHVPSQHMLCMLEFGIYAWSMFSMAGILTFFDSQHF